jgi:energy-coupling factor transport system permease protein
LSSLQLRHVETSSPVHRLRADTKIACLVVFAMALAFNPVWEVIGIGWAAAAVIFVLARLPTAVLAPPPPLFFYVVFFGSVFSLLSGGDPDVAGVGLGGLVDFAQFVTLSVLLVVLAALLVWTTTVSEVGLGLGSLLRPLRLVRLPSDEIATVVALAVRSLPMIRDEIGVVADARRARPPQANGGKGIRAQLVEAVDFGATVVVGAHRRSREMARALVSRGSLTSPDVLDRPHRLGDVVAMIVTVAGAVWIFVAY